MSYFLYLVNVKPFSLGYSISKFIFPPYGARFWTLVNSISIFSISVISSSFPPHLSFVYLPWPNPQMMDLLGFFKKLLFCLSLSSFFFSCIFPVVLKLYLWKIIENCSRAGKRRTKDFWKTFLCQINRPNCYFYLENLVTINSTQILRQLYCWWCLGIRSHTQGIQGKIQEYRVEMR